MHITGLDLNEIGQLVKKVFIIRKFMFEKPPPVYVARIYLCSPNQREKQTEVCGCGWRRGRKCGWPYTHFASC